MRIDGENNPHFEKYKNFKMKIIWSKHQVSHVNSQCMQIYLSLSKIYSMLLVKCDYGKALSQSVY